MCSRICAVFLRICHVIIVSIWRVVRYHGISSAILNDGISSAKMYSLRWRHNDHAGVSNHQPHGCLLNRLFRRRSKKTSKLRVTGLCEGNSPGPVNSPYKGPVTRKMFLFDDVIMSKWLIAQENLNKSNLTLRLAPWLLMAWPLSVLGHRLTNINLYQNDFPYTYHTKC